jgi:hypothetical protein
MLYLNNGNPLLACLLAVPCLRRASEMEKSGNAEFALGGDEEGWVATHQDPAAAASQSAEGSGGASGSGGAAGRKDDDDIPDLNELELDAEDDEVSSLHQGLIK